MQITPRVSPPYLPDNMEALTTFAPKLTLNGIHVSPLSGKGLSPSLNAAVLTAAIETRRNPHVIPLLHEIKKNALEKEWNNAGRRVATQEVLTIVHGGVVEVRTTARGECAVVPVNCQRELISKHVLLAVNLAAPGHDVTTLLADLFEHPRRKEYVRDFSLLAAAARAALSLGDAASLGDAVNAYRVGFDQWTGGLFTRATGEIMADFEKVASGLLGWKPPGAGDCEAVALIHDGSPAARFGAMRFFRGRNWRIWPVRVTHGVTYEPRPDGTIRVSAGHRLDLIGGADLGIDPAIAADGLCLSMAIEPRTMLTARAEWD